MKKFLLKIGLLAVFVLLADVIIGHGLQYITDEIKVGGQGRDNYIANEAEEDILVFGSSRAVHHYNSQLIEDSLGMPCFNCGDDGNGIILSYGRLSMIQERHQPKIIIMDINPHFDLSVNDNHKYLGWLKSHYDKEIIRPIFYSVDEKERFKMMSLLYRYNSKFIQSIFVYLTGKANDGGVKGFRPTHGEMDLMKIKERPKAEDTHKEYLFDSLKLEYIEKFIDASEGAKLFFVVSPIWYGMDTLKFAPVKQICQERGIPFIDFSNDPKYVRNNEVFLDGSHLNSKGADEFTKELVQLIEKEL